MARSLIVASIRVFAAPWDDDRRLALQERLRARLQLSRHYERKMKRVKRDIGLAAAERTRDRVCSRQVNIENRILGMPAMTPRDFAIKIKIYEHHDRYIGADEIVRDVQRLVKWGEVRAAFCRLTLTAPGG
jgi:hypothetical protein